MGALFSLGAGCRKWKPLDIPGTQPPYNAVVNYIYHIIYSWSHSDGKVPSDLSKKIEEDSTCMVPVIINVVFDSTQNYMWILSKIAPLFGLQVSSILPLSTYM